RDAQSRGGGDVDAVESHAVATHHLQSLARLHETGRRARAAAEEDALGLGRRLDHSLLGRIVGDDHAAFALEHGNRVLVERSADDDERPGIGGHASVSFRWATLLASDEHQAWGVE